MRESGQSLFEVVIALGVISIILVSLVTLASLSIRNTTFSQAKTRSTRISQETIEWLRGERDAGWSAFAVRGATPVWCMPALSWAEAVPGACPAGSAYNISGTPFKREVSFGRIDAGNLQTTVLVYWSDSQGAHETRTTTNFTNWRTQ